jgi:sulfatase modifying factor 1
MRLSLIVFSIILSGILSSHADSVTHGGTTINMDFVDIGFAGNNEQSAASRAHAEAGGDGYGAVAYNYRIGQKEVTLTQFAKARAADSRVGDGDEGYWNDGTRTVGTGGPASYVSAYEGMKFANWLTSGDAYTGAYQFDSGGVLTAINRDAAVTTYGTVYILPTENEWYKAAYYKPANDGSYSLYANGSDDVADLTHGTSSGWNYYNGAFVNGSPNYMWEAGDGGLEQNGTFDMMGNVWEWNESAFDGSTNNMNSSRVCRGGPAFEAENTLRSSYRNIGAPTFENFGFGFRVAAITAPPPPPIDLTIHTAIEVEWSSVSGRTYQVQYSTNLVSTNWFDLGSSVMATNAASFMLDSTRGVSNRFYRVINE